MFISLQNYKNFVQLSSTLTKLCHIKCDQLVNFTFHLKNAKIVMSVLQYDSCVSSAPPINKFHFKNPR